MLHRVEDGVEPGERVFLDMVDFIETELHEAAVGDITDIGLDLLRAQALDMTGAEGEVDKGVLMGDDLAAGLVQLLAEFLRPDFRIFGGPKPKFFFVFQSIRPAMLQKLIVFQHSRPAMVPKLL